MSIKSKHGCNDVSPEKKHDFKARADKGKMRASIKRSFNGIETGIPTRDLNHIMKYSPVFNLSTERKYVSKM